MHYPHSMNPSSEWEECCFHHNGRFGLNATFDNCIKLMMSLNLFGLVDLAEKKQLLQTRRDLREEETSEE